MQVSIGGAPSDYIQIKSLLESHVTCIFTDKKLILQARGDIEVVTKNLKEALTPGQRVTLSVDNVLNYKVTFPNKTVVIGRIEKERETLSREARQYLESKYGVLQKIQEGKSCLIYKTYDNRVLKILFPSFHGNIGVVKRFRNAAEKIIYSC